MRNLIAASLLILTYSTATADELLDQVLVGIKADAALNWNFARAMQLFDKNGKAERTSFTRLQNGQWSLLASDGAKPPEDRIKSFAEQAKAGRIDYPRYMNMEKILLSAPVKKNETETTVTYHIAKLPAKSFDYQGEDLSKFVEGDVTIVKGKKPYISQFRMFNLVPFRMSVAKVTKAESTRLFALSPEGLPVATEETTKADASVLFSSIVYHKKITLSEHKLNSAAK
jgi:hypothetical protein